MNQLKRIQASTLGIFFAVALGSSAVLAQSNSSGQAGDAAEAGASMVEQGKADPGNKGSEKGIEKKRENAKAWWNFWG